MNALDAKKKAAQRGGGPPLTLDEERDLQGLIKRFAAVQKQQKMLDALRKARTNAQAQDVPPAAAPAPEQAAPKGKAPGQALGTLQPAAADTRSLQSCLVFPPPRVALLLSLSGLTLFAGSPSKIASLSSDRLVLQRWTAT